MLIRYLALSVLPMQREFTFSEFVAQMTEATRLGRTTSALTLRFGLPEVDLQAEVRRLRAVSASMTPWERDHVEELDTSRRRRIAAGAGVGIIQVSQFLRQFELSREMMRRSGSMTWPGRLGAVLGLVMSDPTNRDPSYVLPRPSNEAWRLIRAAVAIAVCAIITLAVLAFWHR